MKRFTVFLTTVVLAFSMASCAYDEPVVKDELVDTSTAAPAPSRAEVFLRVLRDETDAWDDIPDNDVVDLADTMCDVWANDAAFEEVALVFIQSGYSARDGGAFIGAGTEAFCPEYSYKYKQ